MQKKQLDIAETMEAMHIEYRQGLPGKLRKLRKAFEEFRSGKSEDSLNHLYRIVHGLSGSGKSFGFEEISENAEQLEKLLQKTMRSSVSSADLPSLIESYKKLLDTLVYLQSHKTDKIKPIAKSNRPSKNHLIYIVEDESDLGQDLSKTINNEIENIEIELFSCIKDVKKAISKKTPSIVILDIVLPEGPLAGLEYITKERQRDQIDFLLIYMSKLDDFDTRLSAMESGADYFFSKPIDRTLLITAVRNLTSAHSEDPYRILIVEDDPELADFYAEALKSGGMQVEKEVDPTNVIPRIRLFRPELIIMDVLMPKCSGLKTAAVIRQFVQYSSIPIVFLSTESSFETQLTARDMGGDDYLTKPIDPAQLLSAIETRVRRARRQNELLTTLQATIGQLEEARTNALEAVKHKSVFLANMSHEIRTPLNGILGMARLLSDSTLTPEQREHLELLDNSGVVLLTLINDILGFSKLEAGKVELESLPFSLRDVFDNSARILSSQICSKQLFFSSFVSHDIPTQLIGDGNRLQQILTNLLSNSVKFTERGAVSITAHLVTPPTSEAVTIQIAVEDTGIGLKPEQIERLFQAFSQADSSTTRRYGGTGLGLAISQNLVSLMGGKIDVTSDYGKGSHFSFRITLPQATDTLLAVFKDALIKQRLLIHSESVHFQEHMLMTLEALGAIIIPSKGFTETVKHLTGGDAPLFSGVVIDEALSANKTCELTKILTNHRDLSTTPVFLVGYSAPATEQPKTVSFIELPFRQCKLEGEFIKRLATERFQAYSSIVSIRDEHHAVEITPFSNAQYRPNALVAEDNYVNQIFAEKLLNKLGFDVKIVATGSEAVAAASGGGFDIIFMDCQMPEMDGYQATEIIRNMETDGNRVPIIALTAHALEPERQKCLAHGMDDHLAKPIDLNKLGQVIRQHLAVDTKVLEKTRSA